VKKNLILFIFLFGFSRLYSQTTQPANTANQIYTFVEEIPVFQGDITAYLSKNIRYPKKARKKNIEGSVYVSFIVEKDGSVSNVKIIRSVEGGKSLDKEAVRVVSHMPKWKPGMQSGEPVRVQYTLPIRFRIE